MIRIAMVPVGDAHGPNPRGFSQIPGIAIGELPSSVTPRLNRPLRKRFQCPLTNSKTLLLGYWNSVT